VVCYNSFLKKRDFPGYMKIKKGTVPFIGRRDEKISYIDYLYILFSCSLYASNSS
jgi:hypothetical protein